MLEQMCLQCVHLLASAPFKCFTNCKKFGWAQSSREKIVLKDCDDKHNKSMDIQYSCLMRFKPLCVSIKRRHVVCVPRSLRTLCTVLILSVIETLCDVYIFQESHVGVRQKRCRKQMTHDARVAMLMSETKAHEIVLFYHVNNLLCSHR